MLSPGLYGRAMIRQHPYLCEQRVDASLGVNGRQMTGGLLKVMLEANFLYHWEVTATRQRSWWAHVCERVGDHTTSHWNLLFETSFMYVFFFFSTVILMGLSCISMLQIKKLRLGV